MTFSTLSMWFVPVPVEESVGRFGRYVCGYRRAERSSSSSTRIGIMEIIQPRRPHRRSWRQDRVARVAIRSSGHVPETFGLWLSLILIRPLIVIISPILKTNPPYLSHAPTSSKSSAALTPLVAFCVLLPIEPMVVYWSKRDGEKAETGFGGDSESPAGWIWVRR